MWLDAVCIWIKTQGAIQRSDRGKRPLMYSAKYPVLVKSLDANSRHRRIHVLMVAVTGGTGLVAGVIGFIGLIRPQIVRQKPGRIRTMGIPLPMSRS